MRIGELAHATDTSATTLRFYESVGLIADPGRTPGGYRDYPDSAVERVAFIRRAQAAGLTLGQIAEVLEVRDAGRAPCGELARLVDARLADVTAQLTELEATRAELMAVRQRVARLDPVDCDPRTVCAAVAS